jgi:hypothetical protein
MFKECREVLVSLLSRILQIRPMLLFLNNLSCSIIKSHVLKIMFIQSLIVEMKLKKCQFLKVFFKIKFLQLKIQHTQRHSMQSFDYLIF